MCVHIGGVHVCTLCCIFMCSPQRLVVLLDHCFGVYSFIQDTLQGAVGGDILLKVLMR